MEGLSTYRNITCLRNRTYVKQLLRLYLVLAPQLLQEDWPIPQVKWFWWGYQALCPRVDHQARPARASPGAGHRGQKRRAPLPPGSESGPRSWSAGSQAPRALGRKWSCQTDSQRPRRQSNSLMTTCMFLRFTPGLGKRQ